MNKLRIAQLVLPWMTLPPAGYAGTEQVVNNLTEGLVKRGHDVTLFSVGDTKTSAELASILPHALGLQSDVMGRLKASFYPLLHIGYCFQRQNEFDIIHSHAQFLSLPFAAIAKTATIHTFHRIFEFKTPDETDLVMHYKHLPFTSISNAQRIPDLNFVATVYNGVDTTIYRPGKELKRSHLLWVGRLIEKKGPEEAIEVSKRLSAPLLLVAQITEPEYYEEKIKPQVDGKHIRLIREITPDEMVGIYQDALVTLVPIKWNEPFGLVPVESMACGTPVVAYANGGVRETINDQVTGYLVEEHSGVGGLVEKVKKIQHMSNSEYARMSHAASQHVLDSFSCERMVEDYEKVYQEILTRQS